VIVAYISGYRDRFGVEPICTVLSGHGIQIAPSTYYAHLARPVSAAVLTEAYLANTVVTIHRANWAVTVSARCGTRCATPATRWAATRSGG